MSTPNDWNWSPLEGIPYRFFYYYLSDGLMSQPGSLLPTADTLRYRQLTYRFKGGAPLPFLEDRIAEKLEAADLSNTALVCVPASSQESNSKRFEKFSHRICSRTGMQNGFPHIAVVNEKPPAHLGGCTEVNYGFPDDFFSGKGVLLFDDLVTDGSAMRLTAEELKKQGAHIEGCLSIGKTVLATDVMPNLAHPLTGEPVFRSTDNLSASCLSQSS